MAKRNTRYTYRIVAPGRPEHGELVEFGAGDPPMYAREPFQLRDGTMAHIEYVGVS